MSHGLVLLEDSLVGLAVGVTDCGVTPLVEEELGLVEVLLLSGHGVEFREGHLGDLVSGNDACLSFTGSDFTHNAVGVADRYVEEVPLAGRLVVGDGSFDHVTEVVKFVTQDLFLGPPGVSRPFVGMEGIHCPCGIEVSVTFLCGGDDRENAVDVGLQFGVGVGLENVARALYRLVDVGVVEGEPSDFVSEIDGGMHLLGRFDEVFVASGFLAFGEGQGNGDFA